MTDTPRRNTPMGSLEVARLLLTQFVAVFGVSPSLNLAASLLSLIWIETGGGKSIQNWNFGNISASSRYDGMVWRPTWYAPPTESTSERDRKLHAAMIAKPPTVPSGFRAYSGPVEGMNDYLRVIGKTFPKLLEVGESADANAFREALVSTGYSHDYRNTKATATIAGGIEYFTAILRELGGYGRAAALGGGRVVGALVLFSVGAGALWFARSKGIL